MILQDLIIANVLIWIKFFLSTITYSDTSFDDITKITPFYTQLKGFLIIVVNTWIKHKCNCYNINSWLFF